MSGAWSIANVADWESLWVDVPPGTMSGLLPSRELPDGRAQVLDGVTGLLIWTLLFIHVGEITRQNLREVFLRTRMLGLARGPLLHNLNDSAEGDNEARSISFQDIILANNNADAPARVLLSRLLTIRTRIIPSQRITLFADQLLDRDDPLLPAVIAQPKPRLAVCSCLAGRNGQSVLQAPSLRPTHGGTTTIVLLQDLTKPRPEKNGIGKHAPAFRLRQALQKLGGDKFGELASKSTEAIF